MHIVIVGAGYVGLVTGACFASVGNTVYCVDSDERIITQLQQGNIHIYEPQLQEMVHANIQEERLFFTTNLADVIHNADCVFICVGTPIKADGSCNTSYIYAIAEELGKTIEKNMVIIVKSTVPVGTTEEVAHKIDKEMQARGVTYTISYASNPEFLKEGSAIVDFKKPDRIIIGIDSHSTREFFEELYAPFNRIKNKIIFMHIKSAEMTKYSANALLATKISFINEMAQLCEKNGADIMEVRAGIGADSRIGHHFIYPGVGYGGSCFPKDIQALIFQGESCNLPMRVLHSVKEVNNIQRYFLFNKVSEYYNSDVEGKVIALWGISFKPNTDDIREAPAIYTIKALLEKGAIIKVYDPVAMQNAHTYFKKEGYEEGRVHFAKDMYNALEGAEILCIATEWNIFQLPNFSKIKNLLRYPHIIDGRNIYSKEMLKKLGFTYTYVGGINAD